MVDPPRLRRHAAAPTVRMSVAMEMLLTGERIDAARAYEVGLVSRIVSPEALLPTATQMAERHRPERPAGHQAHQGAGLARAAPAPGGGAALSTPP